MADLIQHGHMTPFGGQIIDGVSHDGIEFSSNSTIPNNSTIPSDSATPSNSLIPSNSAITNKLNSDEMSGDRISDLINTDTNSEIHDEVELHDETGDKGVKIDDLNDDSSDSNGNDDAFIPGLENDDLCDSTSDSYITDDDNDEIRGQSLRVRRYRDVISSESDDDMIHTNKIKHKKIKGKKVLSRRRSRTLTVDDGDDQLYKMRIK